MWRGESRGGLLLLGRLLHLREPPPEEIGGGRPRAAARSDAPRRRAGRAGGGALGPEEGSAGRAGNGARAGVERWRQPRSPRPRGGGQRAAGAPARARWVPPRSALPGPALWSPAAQHPLPPSCRAAAPSGPGSRTGLRTRRRPGGKGWAGPGAPRLPAPGRCAFMNSMNGALTAHTKPFLLLVRDGVGEGLAEWNACFFPKAQKF